MESIHHFLAAHANKKPQDNAFTFIKDSGEQAQISFAQLHKNAQLIAQYLSAEHNIGDRVVLLYPPGLEYIQAFLGCLYAGVVAVPLYPPQSTRNAGRVLAVIEDCQANMILTNTKFKQQSAEEFAAMKVISFEQLLTAPRSSTLVLPSAEQVAFLQYTSGSTGSPKGVVITHGNIVANLKTLQQATHCTEDEVFCNWLPLFHDLGLVNTLLLPIFLGAHSVLMSPVRFIKSPLCWFQAITEFKASICGAPNFAFDHCLERIKPHQLAGIDLSSWRVAFNAAEPVDADTLIRFSERFARVGFKESAIFAAYGMAEATVFICGGQHKAAYTANAFSCDDLQKGRAKLANSKDKEQVLVAHGHVQAEHQLKIVSPETQTEVAQGQIGEIWFAGPSLAQGYWNDKEKTAASFGARLANDENSYLRTGDLGFLFQGELYISGRIKDVLIIKGRNYYPQDLEKLAYAVCPELNQNGAAAFEVNGNAYLLVEVSRKEIKTFDYQQASETIKSAVFEHFEVVLQDVVFLKAGKINRTSSGKIQRSLSKKKYLADQLQYLYSALKPVARTSSLTVVEQDQKVSQLEAQLCALWKKEFEIEHIDVEDNFLNLGGHSLLAVNLIANIKKQWNVDIQVKTFFTAPTIRKLAKVIEQSSKNENQVILPAPKGVEIPLSFAQQRLWLVEKIEQQSTQYNVCRAIKLHGKLNVEALNQTLHTIIERHQILRTNIATTASAQAIQVIQPTFNFTLEQEDLTATKASEENNIITQFINEALSNPFDLHRDLMLRAKLLAFGHNNHTLIISMHHIAVDGWSEGVIVNEINVLYRHFVNGGGADLPLAELAIQYADHAHWQRTYLAGERLDRQLDYWTKQLDQLPPVHSLPLSFPRPEQKKHVGAMVNGNLPADISQKLQTLAKQHQLTPFMLLHGVLALLLSKHSNSNDIVIGTAVANRMQAELEPLIGFFINALVLRTDTNHQNLTEYFAHIRQVHLDAQSNQDVSFEQLVGRLNTPRSSAHTPLFQIMLTTNTDHGLHSGTKLDAMTLPGIKITPYESDTIQAKFDLDVNISLSDKGVRINWTYDVNLFDETYIQKLNQHLCRLLTGFSEVTQSDVDPHSLPMLSENEVHHLTTELNDTRVDYPKDKCIHQLFEQQAHTNPENVAVVFDHAQLTYQQLNEQANQLAHYLIETQQVTSETLVGLCVERSLEMVVGILAILKAGGAYVPISPNLPKSRLQNLIVNNQINTVLTDTMSINKLATIDTKAIVLNDQQVMAKLSQYSTSNLVLKQSDMNERHLAYVIFTSGSTGTPKGVMIEHMACINHCYAMIDRLCLDASCSIAQTAPLSFDISVWQTLTMLLIGGKTVIIKDQIVQSPQDLIKQLKEKRIAVLQIVPSLMSLVLDECESTAKRLPFLQCVSVTGEACPIHLQARWEKVFPDIPLINAYGPAECADDVLLYANKDIANKALSTFTRVESQVRGYCRDYPSLFDKALGSELFDSSGSRFLDLFSGAGALNYGHNNPALKSALIEYIEADGVTHSLDLFTKAKVNFLEVFERHILKPRELEYQVIFPGPTGANAVEAALKLARKVTGRQLVVHAKNSFHGMTLGALSVTDGYQERAGIPLQNTQKMAFVSNDMDYQSASSIKQQFKFFAEKPAAIILELVQAEGGLNVANKQWLTDLFNYAKQQDILIIVDDIQAGCGRTGRFFSFEHYGLKPDLVCLSKSISGYGLPMSLLLIRPDLDIWQPAEHNGTFRGNNHAFITAAKAIELYWSNGQFEKSIQDNSEFLQTQLQSIIAKYPQLQGELKGIGLIQGIKCASPSLVNKIKKSAFAHNLIIEAAGKKADVLKLLPALTMEKQQLRACLQIIDTAIAQALSTNNTVANKSTMPVGKPINNLRVYIVDQHLQLATHGVVGELLVAGDGLSRGYLNQPQMTEQQFLELSIGDKKEKVYRTGDLVRYLPNNDIEFVGRLDDQVKIRGFRIELGEVEVQLSNQAGVDSALVVAKELAGSKQLVGYIKPSIALEEEAYGLFISELKAGISEHLPEHMVPSALVVVQEWPLTANGKVNRKALPEPDSHALQKEYVAPETETQGKIQQIWHKLMERDGIGIEDNFFHIGGHSLMAIRVISACRDIFKVEVKLADFMAAPTIKQLAELITKSMVNQRVAAQVIDADLKLENNQRVIL